MSGGPNRTIWALEGASNPAVLRVHVTTELTTATIETCPPRSAPPPLDGLPSIPGVRALDLHRYRARVNLLPGADAAPVRRTVADVLEAAWGAPAALPPEEEPRAFSVAYRGPRKVAESLRMAGDQPVLAALFRVGGVAEAILSDGLVLVRLGRLFTWTESEAEVVHALTAWPAPRRAE